MTREIEPPRITSCTKPRRASVLIVIIVALVLVQAIAMLMVIMSQRAQNASRLEVSEARARYAADGALQMAVREFATNADEDADAAAGSIRAGQITSGAAMPGPGSTVAAVAIAAGTPPESVLSATASSGEALALSRITLRRIASAANATPGLYTELWSLGSNCFNDINQINWNAVPGWHTVFAQAELPYLTGDPLRAAGGPAHNYAVRMTGSITIPVAGSWTFHLYSDDGALLWINGTLVVDNNGLHSPQWRSGTITLPAGQATIDLRYHECSIEHVLRLEWESSGTPRTVVPASAFTCTPTRPVPSVAAVSTIQLWGPGSANGLVIDGFDSRLGPYGGSNILSDRAVVAINSAASSAWQMSNLATVRGHALTAPGSTPSSVITAWSGSSITGSQSAADVRVLMTLPSLPTGLPASSGAFTLGGAATLSGMQRYTSVSLWNGAVWTVSGNAVVRCDGDFSLSGNARIDLPSTATLTLYIYGNFNVWNTSQINTLTGLPPRVRVHLMGSAPTANITDSAQVCAYIFNPFGTLNITGTTTPPASLHGLYHGNQLVITERGTLRADTHWLDAAASPSSGPAAISVSSVVTVPP